MISNCELLPEASLGVGCDGSKEREDCMYAAVSNRVEPRTDRTELSRCRQEMKTGIC